MKKRAQHNHVSSVIDAVMANLDTVAPVKTAADTAPKNASFPASELGTLMHKLAAEMRNTSVDVTYDDIEDVLRGRS